MHTHTSVLALCCLALLAACSRAPDDAPATPAAPPAPPAATQATPLEPPIAPPPPAVGDTRAPAPPTPVVEGMSVVYTCDTGAQPKITFSGNLVKVELPNSKPVVLSARASSTSMSDTYVGDSLTLHRDGLGITLDLGGGKTMRCTESQASA